MLHSNKFNQVLTCFFVVAFDIPSIIFSIEVSRCVFASFTAHDKIFGLGKRIPESRIPAAPACCPRKGLIGLWFAEKTHSHNP